MIKVVCEVPDCKVESVLTYNIFSGDSVHLPDGWSRVRMDGAGWLDAIVCPSHADAVGAALHGQSVAEWGGS